MARGRPPKPTALKALEGNRGKRKPRADEPKPKIKIPTCPTWMPAAGKAEWKRIAKELASLGLLAEVDRAALIAYASAYAELEKSERELKKGHFVTAVATTTGRTYKKLSPWVKIRKDARKAMLEAIREFGMSPSSRTRVGTGAADGQRGQSAPAKDAAPAFRTFEGGKR